MCVGQVQSGTVSAGCQQRRWKFGCVVVVVALGKQLCSLAPEGWEGDYLVAFGRRLEEKDA